MDVTGIDRSSVDRLWKSRPDRIERFGIRTGVVAVHVFQKTVHLVGYDRHAARVGFHASVERFQRQFIQDRSTQNRFRAGVPFGFATPVFGHLLFVGSKTPGANQFERRECPLDGMALAGSGIADQYTVERGDCRKEVFHFQLDRASYCRSKSRQYCRSAEIERKSQIAVQGMNQFGQRAGKNFLERKYILFRSDSGSLNRCRRFCNLFHRAYAFTGIIAASTSDIRNRVRLPFFRHRISPCRVIRCKVE